MGFEGDLTGILREVVQFLERLRETKLPGDMDQVRDSLLTKSKDTLARLMTNTRTTGSPEPYLDMNAGSKGLMLMKTDPQLGEYIGAEESGQEKLQDYYETFQEVEEPNRSTSIIPQSVIINQSREDDPRTENVLLTIYSSMSTALVKSKAQKYGPLERKEGKKLFVFEQYRSCWVGLVGSHLLIYTNERNNRPCVVQPIRGYMARAAPTAAPRDQKRSESAFEIFRPGSRTLQFIAKSPADMEDWVTNICRLSSIEEKCEDTTTESTTDRFVEVEQTTAKSNIDEDRVKLQEESYENVIGINNPEDNVKTDTPTVAIDEKSVSQGKESNSENNRAAGPPLPARIPRKLPSLPASGSNVIYQGDEEEEDDIYHRIEDFRDSARYQNVTKSEIKIDKTKSIELVDGYDDARTCSAQVMVEEKEKQSEKKDNNEEKKSPECDMIYDDIINAMMRENQISQEDRKKLVSYDDIENLLVKSPSKGRSTEKSDETAKSPQKKSFLDRVRSRRESPRKTEKKVKRESPARPPPPITKPELPTYDDVSDLVISLDTKSLDEELPEYNCPPPPRPLHTKQVIITTETPEIQEVYDDVSACREKYKDETSKNIAEQPSPKKSCDSSMDEIRMNESIENPEDGEHYQTPRKDTCRYNPVCIQQEELYDDVAILMEFTARQRSTAAKQDSEELKLSTSPEKKAWNRFVSVRKTRSAESTGTDANLRSTNEIDDMDELGGEHHGLHRMNTFQRLISKMENSLGKTATKTIPSPFNKTNVPNHS